MRVFLSWHGDVSRELATTLHNWIPLVVPSARPFISTSDIDKGKGWSDVLREQLSHTSYGIVCVTRDNYTAPWLHFEAGAISKAMDKTYVSPLLFNIEPSEIFGPLAEFQLTVCTEDDIRNLMRSINSQLADDVRMSEDVLTLEFNNWWPQLKPKLDALTAEQEGKMWTHTPYTWLFTTEDLTRVQHAKAHTCIWWITPDPFEYVLRSPLQESILDCIERNVTFTFIIPEAKADAKPAFQRIAPDKPNAIKIVDIPTNDFLREAVTDYVVVDPASLPEVYFHAPVETRGYWASVVGEPAGYLVERFRKLAEGHGKELSSSATIVALSATTEIARN